MLKRIFSRFNKRNIIITLLVGVAIYIVIRMIPSLSTKLDTAAAVIKDKLPGNKA